MYLNDMSKFMPTEFIESAKYYTGTHSPIEDAKKDVGYSNAWQHHKAHNKHHYFYWIDQYQEFGGIGIIMPEKYCVEMVCDMIAASKCIKARIIKKITHFNIFSLRSMVILCIL